MFRKKLTPGAPDPDSFIAILVERQYVTSADLEEALRRQEMAKPVGDILVDMGVLTEFQKEEIIVEIARRHGAPSKHVVELELQRQSRLRQAMNASLQSLTAGAHELAAAAKK